MEKIFVKGLRTFPKHANAPDFILGDMVIDIEGFAEHLKNSKNITEYNGRKQLRCQILKGKDGCIQITENTYKK